MTTDTANFASPELASFWVAIQETVDRLLATLDGLSAEQINWRPAAPEANPLSVLAIHTMGNVEENILETLCGQPVNRQRDREFQQSGASVAAIQERWRQLQPRIETALAPLTTDVLTAMHKHPRRDEESGYDVLILVARHAGEHAGQAELTRDLLRAAQA
ncbi:MAG TPA: DinB family protein [Nitrolancea sp.]|jgi:hypothetical protein|nr:DinB family protein [Nitrolancea sp.]